MPVDYTHKECFKVEFKSSYTFTIWPPKRCKFPGNTTLALYSRYPIHTEIIQF
jgi:hypothetical protein